MTKDSYLESLFEYPNDFDLNNELYGRVSAKSDGSSLVDLRKLSEPERIVLYVWGAHGLIGNGGFRYLFAGDLVDFKGMAAAFETIKSDRAAAAWHSALSLFPNSKPPKKVEERRKYMDELGESGRQQLEAHSREIWATERQTTRLLGGYVRTHRAKLLESLSYSGGAESNRAVKELPPPSPNSNEDQVVLWLKSIGARVSKWSNVEDYYYAANFTKPMSGDPICAIEPDGYRRTTDAEILLLLEYEVLKSIRSLDLSDTTITPVALVRLNEFPLLERLVLTGTDVEDSWMSGLAGLPALRLLNLARTKVSDDGLASVGEVSSLRELDLASAQVRGPGLAHLTRLPALTKLSLHGCPLVDVELGDLSNLVRLHSLQLSDTDAGDGVMQSVGNLSELKDLDLSSTQVTDRGLSPLSRLQNLEEFRMDCSKIKGPGLAALSKLPKLQKLNLYEAEIGDEAVQHLAAIVSLKELSLSNTNVSDACLANLSKLVNLTSLSLSDTNVSGDDSLKQLGQLKSLESLSLPESVSQRSKAVLNLKKMLPELRISFY